MNNPDQVGQQPLANEETASVVEPGIAQKMLLLFSNPILLFESLRRQSSWLPPLIILILVSIAAGLIAQPYVMPSVREDVLYYLNNTPNIPEQAIQGAEERFDKAVEQGVAGSLPNILIGGIIMRSVLFFAVVTVIFLVGTIFYGGVTKYVKIMSLYSWVLPIWTLGVLIATPLMIIKNSHNISLSPALLTTPDPTSSTYFFLHNLGLFNIWAIIVLGIGFSVMYGLSRVKGLVTVIGLWMIWIVINSFVPYLNFQTWISGLT
jgi:hypothetical protein